MLANGICKRIFFIGIVCLAAFFLAFLVQAEPSYPETADILQRLYRDEIQALHNYLAFAQKAESENHSNIAHLFRAFAASESIHARNFKDLLSALNVEVEKMPKVQVDVSSTKNNLKYATNLELEEIDAKYPQCIEVLKTENHEAAIQFTTYAWESEKQHRDLLKRIKSGTGIFFGFLTKEFKENPAEYFVCQNCGSTLTEIPKTTCPICGVSTSKYKKIES